MIIRSCARLLLVVGVFGGTACDNATSPSVTPTAGTWAGTTAAGDPVSFTVSSGAIASLSVRVRVSGSCPQSAIQTNFVVTFPITGSTFSTGGGQGTNVNGTFTSSTRANGTASVTTSVGSGGQPCNSTGQTTWTASTQ
jgi:hypothetical protein